MALRPTVRIAGWSTVLIPVVALLAACTSAPVPSAPVSSGPVASAPIPSATVPPAAATTSAATTVFADHPTGSRDVVLRLEETYRLVYPGTSSDEPPIFTLYGDGTVIYTPQVARMVVPIIPERRVARITEQQLAELLEFALGAGGLRDAESQYAEAPVFDDATTIFTVDAAGIRKSVSVYALYQEVEASPEKADREQLRALEND